MGVRVRRRPQEAEAHWRWRTSVADARAPEVSAQQQSAPAGCYRRAAVPIHDGTRRNPQMSLDRRALLAIERSQRVKRQVFRELFVYAHAANTFRKDSNPLRILVFIVPNGSPVFSAISI